MSIHPLAIVLCLLLTSVHLQTCTAPYWEVNSDGSLPVDEAAVIGNNNFTLANVEKSETHNLVKTTWALTSIKGSSRYDNSSISVVFSNNTITVSNITLDVALSFNYSKTKGNNKTVGTGQASISVAVTFVKQAVMDNNKITFQFLNLITVVTLKGTTYVPSPASDDKKEFDSLIRDNVVPQLSQYYNSTLLASIKEQVEKESIVSPYNGNYTYIYNNFTAQIKMDVAQSNLTFDHGVALGFNGSINGHPICSQNTPYDFSSNKASFFSREFAEALLNESLELNPDWINFRVDDTYTSDIFDFQMKDLVDIIPDAIKEYPGLFAKVYTKCNTQGDSGSLTIDAEHSRVATSAVWNCTLYRTGGYNLLAFAANISYTATISQKIDRLMTKVTSMELINTTFEKTSFEISQVAQANLYIRSVLGQLTMFSTVGTNFTQPNRASPQVSYNANYIKVSDALSAMEFEA